METLSAFLSSTGVVPSFGNSLIVGFWTLVLSLLIGVPAAYGLARTPFAGKEPYQLFLLFTRALPIVVLSVPLAQLFLTDGPVRHHLRRDPAAHRARRCRPRS